MIRTIGPARLGFAAALLALLLGPLALGFHSAHAQGVDVATYYGAGVDAGATIGVTLDGAECASTTANDAGQWLVSVGKSDACALEDGLTVGFTVNGEAAEQTETWSEGGGPADAANGTTLTVAEAMPGNGGENGGAMPGNGGDDNGDAMPGNGMEGTPDEPTTGNAGLVSSSSSSSLAALALGFLAVAGIAGARVATRRVS